MFFLDPKNFNQSKGEAKTAAIAALAFSTAFLVFVGGLIGLLVWTEPHPRDTWVLEFASHPAGIAVIVLCGVLWTYVLELFEQLIGSLSRTAEAFTISVVFFIAGILIIILGFRELLELKAYGLAAIVATLVAIAEIAPRQYKIVKKREDKLPPPPRSHRSHH